MSARQAHVAAAGIARRRGRARTFHRTSTGSGGSGCSGLLTLRRPRGGVPRTQALPPRGPLTPSLVPGVVPPVSSSLLLDVPSPRVALATEGRTRPVLRVVVAGWGGALTAAAFPDLGWWPLAFVGITALVLVSRGRGAFVTALLWSVWGAAFFVPHVVWASEAAGPVAWIALAVLQALVVAVVGAAWSFASRAPWLRGRPTLLGLTFASVWVAGEQLRSVVPFGGFPWGRLAFSQVDGPLLALASVAGAPGVSFVVALVGYALAAPFDTTRARVRALTPLALLAGLALAAGPLIPLPSRAESGVIAVGVVQGDVPDDGAPDRARRVLDNHVAGTRDLAAAGTQLDVVVWPENATDVDPRTDVQTRAAVQDAADAVGVPVLVGAMRYRPDARFNDVLVWDPERGFLSSYTKQRPAPFGEYVPLRSFVRLFSSEVDRVPVDMVAGEEPAVLRVPVDRLGRDVPVATVICFEVAYDDVVRDAVRRGAELLVVPTNNASFGRTAQSTQQLAMSRLRAVEHGRATIQASTVGVSAIVAPDGTVLDRTALFTADTQSARLPLRTTLTLADRLSNAPMTIAVVLALGALGAGLQAPAGAPRSRGRDTKEGPT
ncbi:apolipoprotein N-acyltransferase [Cellulomonas hominis]|nr:apolipoprotein N-acyltransferase [Cellulomonas hominis]